MLDFLVLVVGTLVVGGLLFLAGSLLLGRGETQPPAELDRSPVELPDDRPVSADDVRALRMSVALRGYRMTEVDWLLDQFAATLEERDEEIRRLRARLEKAHPEAAEDGTAAEDAMAAEDGTAAEDGMAAEDAPAAEGPVEADGPVENGARSDA